MTTYWSAIDIAKQIAGELALPAPTSFASSTRAQDQQILALVRSAGYELALYYPWQQFVRQFSITTSNGVDSYALPNDWLYFVDQSQWDRTNRWPMLGPKSAQEWAWLKGGLLAQAPRTRFRVMDDKVYLHPVPGATPLSLNMEYVSNYWVLDTTSGLPTDSLDEDGDRPMYNPWLIIKYVKLKFYELKGMPVDGVLQDFLRVFNSLIGKDRGAPKLNLVNAGGQNLIGPWSIPDGSWNVGGTP